MRLRVTFGKTGALRYIGHLDLHRMWERVTRRAGLSLAYTQGFHPQPKIQLAAALPLGFSSRSELVDMWIEGDSEIDQLPASLQEASPPGLKILSVTTVDEKSPPLQTRIVSADYDAVLPSDFISGDLHSKVAELLSSHSLPRVRRGKAYDLRPLIEQMKVVDDSTLFMRLSARSGATGRPEEVLDALGIPTDGAHIERTQLIFKD